MSIGRQNAWSYWLDHAEIITEFGFWSGLSAPKLKRHFHAQTQVTIVLSGARAFQIRGKHYTVFAEQGLIIPAPAISECRLMPPVS
ncbi:hypothetical protein Bind_3593 [Beijerinckia indica subsp. indica ATCC 9039]|uniref:AraC-type arabinose-binding/dimerisation domain-containing protein n=1 Tax=Beijerinckia indica subsp. indica (strain ATCC 9039 / DSM 1715 / NCIMB 8712) TaxID=395963 RepID=B2IG75_BEII9|nr:hypothetical protein Bind_3593 [Beijerinckia indica subsp. indica ATCC 9039]